MKIFLSTLSLRRATPKGNTHYMGVYISIHALLAESDGIPNQVGTWEVISIHALLAESDKLPAREGLADFVFLSTLSLRRATRRSSKTVRRSRYFYPRSPCGERPAQKRYHGSPAADFYPRSPCGERPYVFAAGNKAGAISIHALLAESDYPIYTLPAAPYVISIHALLAESDPAVIKNSTAFSVFLSTLSLRRATRQRTLYGRVRTNFYPRSPCGERRVAKQVFNNHD